MTTTEKTCTDHLHDALAALDKPDPNALNLQVAIESVEKALAVIQSARCEAQAAMDKF